MTVPAAMVGKFHRRELKPPSISFSSAEGRELFRSSLAEGNMEGYFPLAEQFSTQAHPSFCGVGSLSMALNALLLDPGRPWQGSAWRWFDESMLDCCEPLEVVKMKGITLPKVGCLARCNNADVSLNYASETSIETFRRDVISACTMQETISANDCDACTMQEISVDDAVRHIHVVMIVAYSRAILSQSGSGHFSPIGGYNKEKDMILIMDVARFKYPPHWVPLPLLYDAMNTIDETTQKSRGYLMVSASSGRLQSACCQATEAQLQEEKVEAQEGGTTGNFTSVSCEDIIASILPSPSHLCSPSDRLDSILKHSCPFCQVNSDTTTCEITA